MSLALTWSRSAALAWLAARGEALPELPNSAAAGAVPAGALEFLYMDKAGLQGQIGLWTALTDQGRRPPGPALAQTAADLCQVLPGVFVAESRTNDLSLVAGLLRLMVYLGAPRECIAQGAEYLAYQQRSDGSFGYTNPLTGGAPAAEAVRATAEALWALGQAEVVLKSA